jgi:hypothetical protein
MFAATHARFLLPKRASQVSAGDSGPSRGTKPGRGALRWNAGEALPRFLPYIEPEDRRGERAHDPLRSQRQAPQPDAALASGDVGREFAADRSPQNGRGSPPPTTSMWWGHGPSNFRRAPHVRCACPCTAPSRPRKCSRHDRVRSRRATSRRWRRTRDRTMPAHIRGAGPWPARLARPCDGAHLDMTHTYAPPEPQCCELPLSAFFGAAIGAPPRCRAGFHGRVLGDADASERAPPPLRWDDSDWSGHGWRTR